MHLLYDVIRRALFLSPPVVCVLQLFVNAPFGRFAPTTDGVFLVDGIRGWIVMEFFSPLAFIYTLVNRPLATTLADFQPLVPPQTILATLFLVHYINRSLVSPLRTPSRSKAHIIVTILGASFTTINGTLMATYLHSGTAAAFLSNALARPLFWTGIVTWAFGFAGNILHDEILLNIRRNAKAKGKARDDDSRNKLREYYGIPHGYLYTYISYPNYFCEWIEWFGFALAAAPVPSTASFGALLSSIHPPWIFLVSEIFIMISRAYNGHLWYLKKFPDYPKDRKAVIPLIL